MVKSERSLVEINSAHNIITNKKVGRKTRERESERDPGHVYSVLQRERTKITIVIIYIF